MWRKEGMAKVDAKLLTYVLGYTSSKNQINRKWHRHRPMKSNVILRLGANVSLEYRWWRSDHFAKVTAVNFGSNVQLNRSPHANWQAAVAEQQLELSVVMRRSISILQFILTGPFQAHNCWNVKQNFSSLEKLKEVWKYNY